MVSNILLFLFFILYGCYLPPHENFKLALYDSIGRNLDSIPPEHFGGNRKALLNVKPLPNGNSEYIYNYRGGTCHYILEVEPSSNEVVNARFEGTKTDCILIP